MQTHIPDVIGAFFAAENAGDMDALTACFTPQATVRDEGRDYQGPRDIRAWMAGAKAKYQHTATPLAAEPRDGLTVVTARVEGVFPGSPAEIPHAFRLKGDRIEALEIG